MSDFDLLGGAAGGGPPEPDRRPTGVLIGGLVAVVLLALVGVGWMVSSVSGRGGKVDAGAPATTSAAATTTPAPTTTAPPPTTPAAATTTVPAPAPTSTVTTRPVPTAVTVAPSPTPRPTPRPTIVLPTPRPTVSTPGGRLVPVPGVIGLRVKAAGDVLRRAGFKVQVLGGIATPDRDDRRVTAQRPGPGSLARAGSTVLLLTDGI